MSQNAAPQCLATVLITLPPRERSGPRSGNRFGFQHSWALCRLIALHQAGTNYCILFDIFDDVVVLDDHLNPTVANFFQVKTTGSTWTPTALCRQEQGENGPLPSPLGKLYDHYVRFVGYVGAMTFVATANFNIKMTHDPASEDRTKFCLTDTHASEQTKFANKMASEFTLTPPVAGLDKIHFEKTALSLDDHDNHAQGVVTTFLSGYGDGSIPPAPFYRTLKTEVQRRSTKEGAETTFVDMLRARGLTRADVQERLDRVISQAQQADIREAIRTQLTHEHVQPVQSLNITRDVRRYLAERSDQTNLVLVNGAKRAMAELAQFRPPNASATPLTDALTHLESIDCNVFKLVTERYSPTYLQALFLVAYYEHPVQATASQPAEEST